MRRFLPNFWAVCIIILCNLTAFADHGSNPNLTFDINNAQGCSPLPVNFTNQTAINGEDTTNWTFYWYVDGLLIDSTYDFSYTFLTGGNHNIGFEVDSMGTRIGASAGQNINIQGSTGSFSPVDSAEYCPGATIQFNYGSQSDSIVFDLGDGSPFRYTNNFEHTYAAIGSYTVTMYLYDQCGTDTIVQNITISNSASPVINIWSNVNDACKNDSVSFSSNFDNNSGVTFLWDLGDSNASTENAVNHAYADTGNYVVWLHVTNSCGNTDSASTNVRIDTGFGATANIFGWWGQTNCPMETISMYTDQVALSYAWDMGDATILTTRNINHVYGDTGTYNVQLIVENGCGAIDTGYQEIIIAYDTTLSVGAGLNVENYWNEDSIYLCLNQTLIFNNGSWDQDYTIWNFGDGTPLDTSLTNANQDYTYTMEGVYIVSLVAVNDCGSRDTATVTIFASDTMLPSVTLAVFPGGQICPGETVLFFDDENWNVEGLSYSVWFGDGDSIIGVPGNNEPQFDAIAAHTYYGTGSYVYTIEATNICGNTASLTDTLWVSDNSSGGAYFAGGDGDGPNENSACPGDLLEFTGFGGVEIYWDFGSGISDTGSTATHMYPDTGVYNVDAIFLNGCGDLDTVNLTVWIDTVRLPDAWWDMDDWNICANQNTVFIPGDLSYGNGNLSTDYFWNFGDGSPIDSNDITLHQYSTAGIYFPELTATNGCGSRTDQRTVYVNDISIGESGLVITNTACGAATGSITGLSVNTTSTYEWINASGDPVAATLDLTNVGAGNYTLIATATDFACQASSGPHAIINIGAPSAPTMTGNSPTCMGDVVNNIDAQPNNGGTITWYSDAALTDVIGSGNSLTPDQNTTVMYWATETFLGCESPAGIINSIVNPSFHTYQSEWLCGADSMMLGGDYQNTSGVYFDTLFSINGCDSVIETMLAIYPEYWIEDTLSICMGETVWIGGGQQSGPGLYVDNYTTMNGCDSTWSTLLIVYSSYNDTIDITICDNDSVMIHGSYENMPGSYVDNNATLDGCDSTTIVNLFVNPTFQAWDTTWVCIGDSALLQGQYYNTGGSWDFVYSSMDGCDSIRTETLIINPLPIFNVNPLSAIVCSLGDSVVYTITGPDNFVWSPASGLDTTAGSLVVATPNTDTDYVIVATTSNGCIDSTMVSYALSTASVAVADFDHPAGICAGDAVWFNNSSTNASGFDWTFTGGDIAISSMQEPAVTYNSPGTYDITLVAQGCGADSSMSSTIEVYPNYYNTPVSLTICTNDSVMLEGWYTNVGGVYYDTLGTIMGCDSVIETTLTVNNAYEFYSTISICADDSVMLGGAYQDSTGGYMDAYQTTLGCDSILYTWLIVEPLLESWNDIEICEGDSAMIEGDYEFTDGLYTNVYSSAAGCDSTIYTTLIVHSLPTLNVSPDPGVVCSYGDTIWFNVTGAVDYSWSPSAGLDTLAGDNVSAANLTDQVYDIMGIDGNGCLNTTSVEYALSAGGPIADFTVSATEICAGETIDFWNASSDATNSLWVIDGDSSWMQDASKQFTTAGSFDVALTAYGCGADSTITMLSYITVHPNYSSSVTISICSNDSVFLDGVFQTNSGIYYDTLTSIYGCDSVIISDLNVEQVVDAGISDTIALCDDQFLVDLFQFIGGTPDSSGSWTNVDGALGFFNGSITTFTDGPGFYNFIYTVAGNSPCDSASATITVEIIGSPDAGSSNTITACVAAGNADITVGLGMYDGGGAWLDLDGTGLLTDSIFDVAMAGQGTYNFAYAVAGAFPCGSDTAFITLQVVGSPNAGADGSIDACTSDFTLDLENGLDGSQDAGGVWADDNGAPLFFGSTISPAISGAGTFIYTYTVEATGCSDAVATVTLEIYEAPNAGTDSALTTCALTSDLNLDQGILGGDTGGTWLDDDNTGAVTGNIFNAALVGTGLYNFTYVLGANGPCSGDGTTIQVTVDPCAGVENLIMNKVVNIYPNPSSGQLSIEYNGNEMLKFDIYNSLGELISAYSNQIKPGMIQYDLSALPNGLYFINANGTSQKVLLMK